MQQRQVLSHQRHDAFGSRYVTTQRGTYKYHLARSTRPDHVPGSQQQQQQQHCPAPDRSVVDLTAPRRKLLQGMLGSTALAVTPLPAAAQPSPQDAIQTHSTQDAQLSNSRSGITTADPCSSSSSSSIDCCTQQGAAAARDPAINRGCATPADVRQQQQLAGLVPPRQVDLDVEVLRAEMAIAQCTTPLDKHRLLVSLHETNQSAFYSLIQRDVSTWLPLIYTPTIAEACLAWGLLLPRPTGLYVSVRDKGSVGQLLRNWPSDEVRIAVITDGERILGLGDLGAHGMGIPTGKCVVYGAAGAPPEWLLPVTVDVGTNNMTLQNDDLYVGLPQSRVRGQQYDGLMRELVVGLQERFGWRVVLHWEDLAVSNAFNMLQLCRSYQLPTFNDDIQATAAVSVAAVLGAVRIPGVVPVHQQRWMFFGAGQANLGTARLLVKALQQQGMAAAAAKATIWMVDSKGLILNTRQNLTPGKAEFAQSVDNLPGGTAAAAAVGNYSSSSSSSGDDDDPVQQLAVLVSAVQPTALIGAAAVPGAFGKPVIEALMQSISATFGPRARPIVLALSNPTSRAEVSYADAMRWTGDRAVYASGSPFPAIQVDSAAADYGGDSGSSTSNGRSTSSSSRYPGKVLKPSQANNCLVFPGLGLGVVESGATAVTVDLLLAAAQAVADCVTSSELASESVLPNVGRLQEVTAAVKRAVVKQAYRSGLVA